MTTEELAPREGETSEKILEQIQARQRELKATAKTEPVKVSEPPAAPEPMPAENLAPPISAPAQPSPNDKPPEPADSSLPEAVPPEVPKKDYMAQAEAWMKKRGFKSVADVTRSYRELERVLHTKGKLPENGQPAQMPQPGYVPPMPPPQPYPAPAPNVDEIAKRYNMAPEDLTRVAPLASDIAAHEVNRSLGPLVGEINRLRREVSREAELRRLSEDPAFTNPAVQFEMHRILEEEPSILQIEPAPLTYAFNEAMRSIGRRILEGSLTPEASTPTPTGPQLPKTPPNTAGKAGTGTAPAPGLATTKITMASFAALSSSEKEKILDQLGVMPRE